MLYDNDRAARDAPAGEGIGCSGLRAGADRLLRLPLDRRRPRPACLAAHYPGVAPRQAEPDDDRSRTGGARTPGLAYAPRSRRSRPARCAGAQDVGRRGAERDRHRPAAGKALTAHHRVRLQTAGFDPMLRRYAEDASMAVKRKAKAADPAEPHVSPE